MSKKPFDPRQYQTNTIPPGLLEDGLKVQGERRRAAQERKAIRASVATAEAFPSPLPVLVPSKSDERTLLPLLRRFTRNWRQQVGVLVALALLLSIAFVASRLIRSNAELVTGPVAAPPRVQSVPPSSGAGPAISPSASDRTLLANEKLVAAPSSEASAAPTASVERRPSAEAMRTLPSRRVDGAQIRPERGARGAQQQPPARQPESTSSAGTTAVTPKERPNEILFH